MELGGRRRRRREDNTMRDADTGARTAKGKQRGWHGAARGGRGARDAGHGGGFGADVCCPFAPFSSSMRFSICSSLLFVALCGPTKTQGAVIGEARAAPEPRVVRRHSPCHGSADPALSRRHCSGPWTAVAPVVHRGRDRLGQAPLCPARNRPPRKWCDLGLAQCRVARCDAQRHGPRPVTSAWRQRAGVVPAGCCWTTTGWVCQARRLTPPSRRCATRCVARWHGSRPATLAWRRSRGVV